MIIPESLKSVFPVILKESKVISGLEEEVPSVFDFTKFYFKNEDNKIKLLSSVLYFCYPGLGNKNSVDPTLYSIMIKTSPSSSDQYTADLFTDDAINKAMEEGQFDTEGEDSLAATRKTLFQYLVSDKIGGKASFNNMVNYLMLKGETEEEARTSIKTLSKLGFITRGTEFRTYYYITELGKALVKHLHSISGIAMVYKDAKRIWAGEVAKQVLVDFENSQTGTKTLEFCITPINSDNTPEWDPIYIPEEEDDDYSDDWDELDLEDDAPVEEAEESEEAEEIQEIEMESTEEVKEPEEPEEPVSPVRTIKTKEPIVMNGTSKKDMAKEEYHILMELLINARNSGEAEKAALLMKLLSEAIDRMV